MSSCVSPKACANLFSTMRTKCARVSSSCGNQPAACVRLQERNVLPRQWEAARRSPTICATDCRHLSFEAVKALLDAAGISYIENSTLVRGLDYYTRTVFEVQVHRGHGFSERHRRRRSLRQACRICRRPSTPGLGFALGFERMVLALEAAGAVGESTKRVDG